MTQQKPRLGERVARRAVLDLFRGLEGGELKVTESYGPGHAEHRFGASSPDGLVAEVIVQDASFWKRVALGGSIGAAEAYVEELWESPSVTDVVRLIARNPRINSGLESGFAAWMQSLYRRWHDLRENTKRGSRTNIAAHYDLGNDFFKLFLDPTMAYSCAVFHDRTDTLEDAQRRKFDLIGAKLDIGPEHEILEIGTGWGGFAVHAATRFGCRVVTTTISQEQHRGALAYVRRAGVEDRVTLSREDYRDLPDRFGARRFDRVVSIEMIEAVGEAYLGAYFEVCDRLLKPDGAALIQAIVMASDRYDEYRTSTDFIQRYIFPGGFLPSLGAIESALSATSLTVADIDDITSHYPPTLRAWARQIEVSFDKLGGLGYSADFLRLWVFYLGYCEGGFLERTIGDVQLLLTAPAYPVADPSPRAPIYPDGRISFTESEIDR